MSGNSIITYYWHMLVNMVDNWGLPWDKYLTAYALLAFIVYAIGHLFKALRGA